MNDIRELAICIGKDMLEPVGYLPAGIAIGCILVACRKLWYQALEKAKGKNGRRPLERQSAGETGIYFLVIVYLVVLLNLTFFSREPGSRKGIDMELFGTWGKSARLRAYFIENIMLFLPFGILLPQAVRRFRSFWVCLAAGFCSSLSLELFQLISQRGFCQLDDIVTNTAGAGIGWVISWLLFRKGKR